MIDQRTAPWAVLLLRVSLGLLFIAHLYWKFAILDGGLDKWWANFAANGYPAITPWYCISAEFAGALLLIPGIWTRWVSLYALPLILGAAQYWAVRKGFYFTIGVRSCRSFGGCCWFCRHCLAMGHMQPFRVRCRDRLFRKARKLRALGSVALAATLVSLQLAWRSDRDSVKKKACRMMRPSAKGFAPGADGQSCGVGYFRRVLVTSPVSRQISKHMH